MAKGPPQPSSLKRPTSHHSSPYPGNEQTPYPTPPAKSGGREVTGPVKKHTVPMHVTKHSNPVGRPKNPRY